MRNLAKGLPAEWIHPACEQQLRHPLGKKRMAAVRRVLGRSRLKTCKWKHSQTAKKPHVVYLGTLPSVDEHLEFARRESRPWPRATASTSGTGRTANRPPKYTARRVGAGGRRDPRLRLIFDGRYINMFAPYEVMLKNERVFLT
mmetsp:Transcript_40048/g.101388  ORF Transcript_40048/g.101388 Transcript_40048/m.101388 type:complete len:144 (+) Transcript_40048:183-614(+)